MIVIGRDVTVYEWTTGVGVINMAGRWESIDLTLKRSWSDVTDSDALEPTRRPQLLDWSAVCKGFVNQDGSMAIRAFLSSPYCILAFEDIVSGAGCLLRGGINEAGGTWEMQCTKDRLSVFDVGNEIFGGLPTFEYGGILTWSDSNSGLISVR